jgi:hypothetical protein
VLFHAAANHNFTVFLSPHDRRHIVPVACVVPFIASRHSFGSCNIDPSKVFNGLLFLVDRKIVGEFEDVRSRIPALARILHREWIVVDVFFGITVQLGDIDEFEFIIRLVCYSF